MDGYNMKMSVVWSGINLFPDQGKEIFFVHFLQLTNVCVSVKVRESAHHLIYISKNNYLRNYQYLHLCPLIIIFGKSWMLEHPGTPFFPSPCGSVVVAGCC